MNLIQVLWEGPFTLKQLDKLNNQYKDYGVYQIYGFHPVYGKDVLLYIGQANYQTSYKRINQENWDQENDSESIKVYIGRIAGANNVDEDFWAECIDFVEKLLIYVHMPAHNSKSLYTIPNKKLQDVHILNWGDHRDILPELSGARWTSKLDNEDLNPYYVEEE